jgi:hypothetical protein
MFDESAMPERLQTAQRRPPARLALALRGHASCRPVVCIAGALVVMAQATSDARAQEVTRLAARGAPVAAAIRLSGILLNGVPARAAAGARPCRSAAGTSAGLREIASAVTHR